MKRPNLNLPDLRVVVQHNNLVNAKYIMGTLEMKIFLVMLAMITKDKKELGEFHIPVSLFYDKPTGSSYQNIKRAGDSLTKRNITVEELSRKEFASFPLMRYCKYTHGEGHIRVRFNEDVVPYLLQLQGSFTMCDFPTLFQMSTSYAIRFYMWLRARHRWTSVDIDLDYLRQLLDLNGKYLAWRDLKKRIIEPICEELSQTDMAFSYDTNRIGRSISSLTINRIRATQPIQLKMFDISTTNESEKLDVSTALTEQVALGKDGQPVNYTHNALRVLKKWSLSDHQIGKLLSTTSHKHVCELSYQLNLESEKVKMGNRTGWAYQEFIKRLGLATHKNAI